MILAQRPDLIQDLEWQPKASIADRGQADPVKSGLLSFRNGQKYRIVITYDRFRIEGMTEDDMIAGISSSYGTPARPKLEIPYHSIYGETAPLIARWEEADNSANLVRTGDHAGFALILYSKAADAAAQTAITAAVRLETNEAPQRELEEQKKRAAQDRIVLDKARSVNRQNFRP